MDLGTAQTSEHEANHSQVDHRLPRLGFPFVVAVESATTAQPGKGPLHDPAARQHPEGMQLGALDDLERATPPLAGLLHQRSRIAPVGPEVLDPAGSLVGKESREQLPSGVAVLNVGWQHHHPQHQTERIDQDMSFSAVDFLARIVTPFFAHLGALDALAIEDGRAGMALATFDPAQMLSQMGMDLFPQTVELPEPEVMVDGAPGSKVPGQVAPLRAGFDEIEDGIEQLPERVLAPPTALAGLGKAVVDELPFGVSQIRCVSHRERIADCGTRYKLTLT